MDVGFYLGELLMQVGEVSVPGLGYFVQARMSGYYDEQDGNFYPPYHKVQFDVQSIDDDALAEYIANKKGISLASSRYFCEKYITSLKQQALVGEVAIGNLGWFYTDQGQLTFRPADKLIDDTIFYGYRPIQLNKAGVAPAPEPEKPVITRPDLIYPTRYAKPEPEPEPQPEPEAEYETGTGEAEYETGSAEAENQYGYDEEFLNPDEEYEEEESRGPMRTIIMVGAVVLVLLIGIFALKTYAPEAFEKIQFWKNKGVTVPLPVDKDSTQTAPADTLIPDTTVKVDSTMKDTVAVAPTAAAATPESRYEVIVGSLKNIGDANKAITAFKKKGIDAKIVTDAPGQRIKLTAGTFKTYKEAEDAATMLLNEKKLKPGDTYPQKITPEQQP